jgi:hypothetical protein
MKPSAFFISIALAACTWAGPLAAQQPPVSPRESVAARIERSDITIVYGRPYVRDPRTGEARKIWGGLVPFGRVWRTGANEATTLTTTRDLELGGKTLAAGTYTLFTIPDERGGKLIVNQQTGQWGTQYDSSKDLLQVDMKREALRAPVPQFTIQIETQAAGGVLKLQWADVQYSVPFTVKG